MRSMILAAAVVLAASELGAQRLPDRIASSRDTMTAAGPATMPQISSYQPATGQMVFGGIAGAALLTVAGGYAGYYTVKGCQDWFCELGPTLLGATIGEVIGLPLGVRMAGGGGSFGKQTLISGGVFVLGAIAAPFTVGASMIAVVPTQLYFVLRNARQPQPAKGEATR
jgi:hypothetical protein